jgi:hypothetical protein
MRCISYPYPQLQEQRIAIMNLFVERHRDKISGVLSCFDRVVITGTLPDIGYAGAMAGYLSYHKIRLFDYPRWAEPVRGEFVIIT